MVDGELPSMSEVARRLARLEDRLDARTLLIDVYQAEKAAQVDRVKGLSERIEALEDAQRAATRLLIGAFLGLIGQAVILIVTMTGRT